MDASAPAARRTLVGALLALLALAAGLFAWLGGGAERAARGPGEPVAAPLPAVLREPLEERATQGTGSSEDADEVAPEVDGGEPGVPGEPAGDRRRRVADGPAPPGEGRLVLRPPMEGVVWVGCGGSLPLDAPAAPAAAALAGGFVRRIGGSGHSGERVVGGLPPGPLRLLVALPGGARIERDDLWILPDETLDLGELAPQPTQTLVLLVRGPDGAAVPDVLVARLGERPGGARDALGVGAAIPLAHTDANGLAQVDLPIGGWTLRLVDLRPPPFQAARLAPLTLDGASWDEEQEPRVLEVELGVGAAVQGDLLDPDELGFAGRKVAAWSPAGPGPDPRAALALGVPVDALATVFGATVGADRRFAFTGLPGDALLRLRALVDSDLSRPDAFAPPLTARAGERDLVLEQRAGATLALELVDGSTLAPIPSFTAELAGTWPGGARSGRDGRLEWTGLRPFEAADDASFADLPESPDLFLSLVAEGYDVTLAPPLRLRTGETTDAGRLALRPLPFVHLRVLDAVDGSPLEGAQCELVALAPERAVGRSASADTSDAEGRARLTQTAFNAAELVVRCPGFAPLRLRAPAANLSDQPLALELAPAATVRARVVDGDGLPLRAEVLRRRTAVETGDALAESYERALTDADGWVTFRDLPAGAVAIAARELPRSDLDAPPPTAAMLWSSVGAPMGGTNAVEIGALAAHAVALDLEWQGKRLPGAVVRLSADAAAFSAPHDDARTFTTGPAVRTDELGRAELGALHAGLYALRVEHPLVPGFARALLHVTGAGPRTLELASDRLRGEVLFDGQRVSVGRVVVWAHGPYHERGMEVQPGAVLHELVPDALVLGEAQLEGGFFDVAVPPGVELIVTAESGGRSGDYFVEVPEGPRAFLSVHVETSLELSVAPELRGKTSPTRELAVVGYNLKHPWGRGLFVLRFDAGDLRVRDLPPGRWNLCLVESAAGRLVLERGEWRSFELGGGRAGVRLPWKGR